MIVFVQPFGLQSPGGGSRILRALLEGAPQPFVSVSTDPEAPPATSLGEEVHMPLRPSFGRLEHTRFRPFLDSLEPHFTRKFKNDLKALCQRKRATGIHALPHTSDFWYAYEVAKELNLPYYLTVHDDIAYTMRERSNVGDALAKLKQAWQNATERTVICEEMGQEYNRRYGQRSYVKVTDGLVQVAEGPLVRPEKSLRIYFMGLFHHAYSKNLNALLTALKAVKAQRKDLTISLVFRCGAIPPEAFVEGIEVQVLPFGSEKDVARDMESADLLYMPLPFGEAYELFVRYSLSTKMITYLGSGLPILYHGPDYAAAGKLLAQHNAALILDSLEPDLIAGRVQMALEHRTPVVQNALELARENFMLSQQQNRFWQVLCAPR